MQSFIRLLSVALLAVSANAAATTCVPPFLQGVPGASAVVVPNVTPDTQTIADTTAAVVQKSGADLDALPNQPVADTTVTAVNGQVVANGTTVTSLASRSGNYKRQVAGYEQVFAGTGTGLNDRYGQGDLQVTYSRGYHGHLSLSTAASSPSH
ncbi:hypothetical protein C0991_001976 [Blastosporella zonata]|nr:hypothetical protein C0991_001976 [Blastosporella zonata]